MTERKNSFAGRRAVLATMHGKEQVVAPVFLATLDLIVVPATGVDTDAPSAQTTIEGVFQPSRMPCGDRNNFTNGLT